MNPIVPRPKNEPVRTYEPGSDERKKLQQAIADLEKEMIEIPAIINGKEVFSGNKDYYVQSHDFNKKLAVYHKVGKKEIRQAIESAIKARKEWENLPLYHRASVFLKAAELLAGKYRYTLNAATMLGQSKTVHQAEIDSACELIDFWRFNSFLAGQISQRQPMVSPQGVWNSMDFRPLEGFIFAITPFNFTSIAGNLPTSPALMGNGVVWKPAQTAVYSGYFIMKILQEAGLPDGVINFLPGSGAEIGDAVVESVDLAGVHFTGSTNVFTHIWQIIAKNLKQYKAYPRFVGETGGKDYIIAHDTADVRALATASVRGAFEYQGQKCSAVSRMYIPDTIYKEWYDCISEMMATVKMGPPQDFSNFVNAVIDKPAFDNISGYIEEVRKSAEAEIIWGGNYSDKEGYYIEPTIVKTTNPKFKTMQEELFGPVLTVYEYKAKEYEQTLHLCDETSPYGLTGAVFANSRSAIDRAVKILRHNAGNFYINDKPTGAVVGQQPFGGGRASGTNDKAGSDLNLYRWVSARTIKENFKPEYDYRYPFMKS